MSLAFDKQGKPFAFTRRAKKLLVRLFRNPGARGTCSQVLGADGQPLYVDTETDWSSGAPSITCPVCIASTNAMTTATSWTTRKPRMFRSISRATERVATAARVT